MGIAFQSLKNEDTENISYIIPTPGIEHFINGETLLSRSGWLHCKHEQEGLAAVQTRLDHPPLCRSVSCNLKSLGLGGTREAQLCRGSLWPVAPGMQPAHRGHNAAQQRLLWGCPITV